MLILRCTERQTKERKEGKKGGQEGGWRENEGRAGRKRDKREQGEKGIRHSLPCHECAAWVKCLCWVHYFDPLCFACTDLSHSGNAFFDNNQAIEVARSSNKICHCSCHFTLQFTWIQGIQKYLVSILCFTLIRNVGKTEIPIVLVQDCNVLNKKRLP